jgi:hypothetical protein
MTWGTIGTLRCKIVRTQETLLRLLRRCNPVRDGEIERDMKQQGRGSTFITVNETGRRLLRILPQQ